MFQNTITRKYLKSTYSAFFCFFKLYACFATWPASLHHSLLPNNSTCFGPAFTNSPKLFKACGFTDVPKRQWNCKYVPIVLNDWQVVPLRPVGCLIDGIAQCRSTPEHKAKKQNKNNIWTWTKARAQEHRAWWRVRTLYMLVRHNDVWQWPNSLLGHYVRTRTPLPLTHFLTIDEWLHASEWTEQGTCLATKLSLLNMLVGRRAGPWKWRRHMQQAEGEEYI